MAKKADKDVLLVAVDFSPYSEQAFFCRPTGRKT